MWEGSRDFVPSLRFDVVPQPAVHNVILVHFCPHELFAFAYSGHVYGQTQNKVSSKDPVHPRELKAGMSNKAADMSGKAADMSSKDPPVAINRDHQL